MLEFLVQSSWFAGVLMTQGIRFPGLYALVFPPFPLRVSFFFKFVVSPSIVCFPNTFLTSESENLISVTGVPLGLVKGRLLPRSPEATLVITGFCQGNKEYQR